MPIRSIRTDDEHKAALREIEALWGSKAGLAGDRLDLLTISVENYERARWPMASLDPFSPIGAAKGRSS